MDNVVITILPYALSLLFFLVQVAIVQGLSDVLALSFPSPSAKTKLNINALPVYNIAYVCKHHYFLINLFEHEIICKSKEGMGNYSECDILLYTQNISSLYTTTMLKPTWPHRHPYYSRCIMYSSYKFKRWWKLIN